MKIYLTILFSFLLIPCLALAANTDVTFSESAVITVGGINLTVSSTANFDSIVVGENDLTISMSKGSTLVVTSADKRKFTVSPNQYQESFVCGASLSTLTVRQNIWDATVTVTVTPSSDACSVAGGGGNPGGSSPGGGGNVPTPVYVTIPGTAQTTTTPAPATSAITSVSPVFTSVMKVGVSNSDVKRLQQLLNSDPDTAIASSGVGSAGNETEYYGSLTREAVKRFQAKYGVVSSGSEETTGYGLVGPGTRAKLQEVFSAGVSVPSMPTTPSTPVVSVGGVSAVFSIGLAKGETNSDVKRLQQLLNSDPDTVIASSGVGSAGNETDYYGGLTEQAVQKFQMKYGLVGSASDAGYGYVGPKTRAKLQEVFGNAQQAPATTVAPTAPSSVQAELETQMQSLLQQLETLQAELNAM